MKTETIVSEIPNGLVLGRQKIEENGKIVRYVVKEHHERDKEGKVFPELKYRVIRYVR